MSASREKKNRQERAGSGWTDPRTAREEKQRREEKRSSILYAVIAIVFVAVAAVVIVWKSNIIPKMSTAAEVDGEKYGVAEVTFYYQNAYRGFCSQNYYNMAYGLLSLNTGASLENQTITENDAAMLNLAPEEAGQTWKDYFVGLGLEQLASVRTALKTAQAEGFVYPDSVQTQYDEQMASLRTVAQASGMSATQYLRAQWGGYITEKVYGEQLLRMLRYSAYADAYEDSLTYSDAELEAAYGEDRSSYDLADFEYVRVDGEAEETRDADGNTVEPTEEESDAALEAARATAIAIHAAWQAGGQDLEALAGEYENASYTNREGGSYSSSGLNDWVFDEARKDGDSTVLESGTDCYAAVFHRRYREEYNTVAVRHILLMADDSVLDPESGFYESDLQALKDETKAAAEDLLAQWKAGEATEDSFAALANERSEDGGSNTSGGLYSQFARGQMVEEFNDWCFDPARRPGDTGIVYGESSGYKGYHIMYFVGTDIPFWQVQVTAALKNKAFSEWESVFGEDHAITRSSGIRYVG